MMVKVECCFHDLRIERNFGVRVLSRTEAVNRIETEDSTLRGHILSELENLVGDLEQPSFF